MYTQKFVDQLIHHHGLCGVSGKPLSDCKRLNVVHLTKKATWSYPVWRNMFTGERDLAMTFVHDDVIIGDVIQGEIANAIEVTNGKIIYHPYKELS